MHPVNESKSKSAIVALDLSVERPLMEAPRKGELIFHPYVDWILSHLVLAAPAQLTAELVPGAETVSWHLRSLNSSDERIADTLKASFFRPVLARIAINYMSGCVYGGYRRFILRAGAASHHVAFYLGNDALHGLWFRARCSAIISNDEVRSD